MSNMREVLEQIAITISDHGNVAVSKGLQWFGVAGSSVGGATWVATNKEVVEQGMSLSSMGAVVGIVGGLTLILKNGVDIYFAWKKHKREKRNTQKD